MTVDEQRTGIHAWLSVSWIYDMFQNVTGIRRARRLYAKEFIRAWPGCRIIEFGCGTGAILEFLPQDIHYNGYDANPHYIRNAQTQWGRPGVEFHCVRVGEMAGVILRHNCDMALANGILHHLDDGEALDLFHLASHALVPGGVLVAIDPARLREHGPWHRLVSRLDRGQHIRYPEQYMSLARKVFAEVETATVENPTWLPCTAWIMRAFMPRKIESGE